MPHHQRTATCMIFAVCILALLLVSIESVHTQSPSSFVPITDDMLQDPSDEDWLMWRRTLDSWGYSPLDEINTDNVDQLRLVWSRGLRQGAQQGTPLAYNGMLYMPNPNDIIQAINAVTGDLVWEYQRPIPADINEYMGGLISVNRNIAIYGNTIIDTANDDYIFALNAETGTLTWETQIFDYTKNPARHSAGPIIANGKVISGRSCRVDSSSQNQANLVTKPGVTCPTKSARMWVPGWCPVTMQNSISSTSARPSRPRRQNSCSAEPTRHTCTITPHSHSTAIQVRSCGTTNI